MVRRVDHTQPFTQPSPSPTGKEEVHPTHVPMGSLRPLKERKIEVLESNGKRSIPLPQLNASVPSLSTHNFSIGR